MNFKTIWPGWYAGRAIHIHVCARKLAHTGATIAGYTTRSIAHGYAATFNIVVDTAEVSAR